MVIVGRETELLYAEGSSSSHGELTKTWSKFGLNYVEKVVIWDAQKDPPLDDQEKFFLVGSLWTNQPFSHSVHSLIS